MTYGYLRVSTDKQDENTQKIGVDHKAKTMGLKINEYIIDHGISGTVEPNKRELGTLMNKLKIGDIIIASELSRLGRNMMMVMRILEFCMKNRIKVITVKDNYELGDNIQSKVLAFAFSLAAEIERDLISRRIKEGLARRKASGIKLGRKKGCLSKTTKLTGKEKTIKNLVKKKYSKVEIARIIGVNRHTLDNYLKKLKIKYGGNNTFKRQCSENRNRPAFEKLLDKEKEIILLRKHKVTLNELQQIFKVSKYTMDKFIKERGINAIK